MFQILYSKLSKYIKLHMLIIIGSQMNARLILRMRFPARTLLHAIQCAKRKLAPSRLSQPVPPERGRHIPDLLSAMRSPPSPQTSPAPTPLVTSQNASERTATASNPPHCIPQLVLNACLELFAPIGFLPSNGEFALPKLFYAFLHFVFIILARVYSHC